MVERTCVLNGVKSAIARSDERVLVAERSLALTTIKQTRHPGMVASQLISSSTKKITLQMAANPSVL
jgi:hypothetical protein